MKSLNHFITFLITALITISSSLLASASAQAGTPKIVFLSSVSVDSWLHRNFDRRMERLFERQIKKNLDEQNVEIVIRDNADLYDAWNALHSPDNVAVFWFSHAGWGNNGEHGFKNDDLIVDKAGFNIKKAFENPNQNLRWLSVISCNSKKILADLKTAGYFSKNEKLTIQGFDRKVIARKALKESVSASRETLLSAIKNWDSSATDSDQTNLGEPLTLVRHLGVNSPAVSVQVGGNVLGVFPKGLPGETQTLTVYASVTRGASENTIKQELKVVIDSGTILNPNQLDLDLGTYDIHSTSPLLNDGHWLVFATPDGHPIGVGIRIYRFSHTSGPPQIMNVL